MAFFGKFKSGISKAFGAAKKILGRKQPIVPARSPSIQTKAATGQLAATQARERKRLLQERVENRQRAKEGLPPKVKPSPSGEPDVLRGESEKIYKNKNKFSGNAPTLDGFLDGHIFSQFLSSNVEALCYDRINKHLHMLYLRRKGKPSVWYLYGQIGLSEATIAYRSASKGVFSWTFLRGKKPFAKGDPPPDYLPLGQEDQKVNEAGARAMRKKIE